MGFMLYAHTIYKHAKAKLFTTYKPFICRWCQWCGCGWLSLLLLLLLLLIVVCASSSVHPAESNVWFVNADGFSAFCTNE